MKYTLLELTQKVLSSIDGDEVNGISDTIEARQVVDIIERVYNEISPKSELPEDLRLFKLEASLTCPVVMTRPEQFDDIRWIQYDCIDVSETAPNYKEIRYLLPEDFIRETLGYANTGGSNVLSSVITQDTGQTVTFWFTNDAPPKYWTSFDDETVVFNSYQSAIEANLQQSKTLAYGRFIKEFIRQDDFVPPFDENLFPLLLNESISVAWAELKQSMNAKVEKGARRNWISSQKRKHDLPGHQNPLDDLQNYGR